MLESPSHGTIAKPPSCVHELEARVPIPWPFEPLPPTLSTKGSCIFDELAETDSPLAWRAGLACAVWLHLFLRVQFVRALCFSCCVNACCVAQGTVAKFMPLKHVSRSACGSRLSHPLNPPFNKCQVGWLVVMSLYGAASFSFHGARSHLVFVALPCSHSMVLAALFMVVKPCSH